MIKHVGILIFLGMYMTKVLIVWNIYREHGNGAGIKITRKEFEDFIKERGIKNWKSFRVKFPKGMWGGIASDNIIMFIYLLIVACYLW